MIEISQDNKDILNRAYQGYKYLKEWSEAHKDGGDQFNVNGYLESGDGSFKVKKPSHELKRAIEHFYLDRGGSHNSLHSLYYDFEKNQAEAFFIGDGKFFILPNYIPDLFYDELLESIDHLCSRIAEHQVIVDLAKMLANEKLRQLGIRG